MTSLPGPARLDAWRSVANSLDAAAPRLPLDLRAEMHAHRARLELAGARYDATANAHALCAGFRPVAPLEAHDRAARLVHYAASLAGIVAPPTSTPEALLRGWRDARRALAALACAENPSDRTRRAADALRRTDDAVRAAADLHGLDAADLPARELPPGAAETSTARDTAACELAPLIDHGVDLLALADALFPPDTSR